MIEKKSKTKGQGLVEFAIMLPVVLVLVFGLVEFGRLLLTYSAVVTASREAARYGATIGDNGSGIPRYLDCDGMKDAALRFGRFGGLTEANIEIRYDLGAIGGTFYTCDEVFPYADTLLAGFGHRIVVSTTKTWTTVIPFMDNLGSVDINAASSRTIIKDLKILD